MYGWIFGFVTVIMFAAPAIAKMAALWADVNAALAPVFGG